MAVTLEISVTFTIKELRCELSSSLNFISHSEEEVILFWQITVMFEMKNKNESKSKQDEKRPLNNLTIKLANRASFLVEV